jgi:hypothetical protein
MLSEGEVLIVIKVQDRDKEHLHKPVSGAMQA